MGMPVYKGYNVEDIGDLWLSRWRYSDDVKGNLIERALMRSGRVAIMNDVIFSAEVVIEDLKGDVKQATLTSVNIGGEQKTGSFDSTQYTYISPQLTSLLDVSKYARMRKEALLTIQSIMSKMRTPLMFKSPNKDVKMTPCVIDDIVHSEIVTIGGDVLFENLDFHVTESIVDVIQMYHDIESILLKKLGIPATFLSRSSGMGQGEVDDASAMDDLIRERELKIRKEICSNLGMTVEWALGGEKNVDLRNNDNGQANIE